MTKSVKHENSHANKSQLGILAEDDIIGKALEQVFKDSPDQIKCRELSNGRKVFMLTEESFDGLCELMRDQTLKSEMEELIELTPIKDDANRAQ